MTRRFTHVLLCVVPGDVLHRPSSDKDALETGRVPAGEARVGPSRSVTSKAQCFVLLLRHVCASFLSF